MSFSKKIASFTKTCILLALTASAIGSTVERGGESGLKAEAPSDIFRTTNYLQDLSGVSDEEFRSLMKIIVPPQLQSFLPNLNSNGVKADIPIIPGLNISESCKGHTLEVLIRLAAWTQRNSTWALHMVDSWGKIPEGFLSGHVNSMGDFDECVGVKVTDLEILSPSNPKNLDGNFGGKFCNLIVVPAVDVERRGAVSIEELWELIGIQQGLRIYPSTAVCLPSSCSTEDVHTIATAIYKPLGLVTTVQTCDVKRERVLTTGDWAMVGVLGAIGLLVFIGTLLDGWMARDVDPDKAKRKPGTGVQALIAFSLITNIRKWQSVGHGGGDNMACLHGLRFMSTLWVILAHTYYMVIYVPWWNMVDVKLVHKNWTALTVINGTVAVDTFFVMGGLLVSYNLLKNYEKTEGRLNYVMYLVHRYLRLTPTYAILVGIMATIFPYLGSGPYWALMDDWGQYCRDHWWTNLLYINNLVYTTEICQAEAWYLSDDMQFYIFTPLVVYPLWKFKLLGVGSLGLLTLLSIAAPGLQVHFENRPIPTVIGTRFNGTFYNDVYIKPWARVQTYLVGMWLGYIMFKLRGKKVKLAPPVVMAGWVASTAIVGSVLYGIYPWFDPLTEIPEGWKIIYACFNRFAFAVSISWVIFACTNGYGGYINSFLSWTPFVPLGRLSFTTYLVSLHVQTILHLTFRQPMHFSAYIITNFFFAHVIMSVLVGFVCTIMFESPFIQLEKLLFAGNQGPRPAQIKTKPPSQRYGIFYNTMDTILNGLEKEEEKNNNNNSNEVKPGV